MCRQGCDVFRRLCGGRIVCSSRRLYAGRIVCRRLCAGGCVQEEEEGNSPITLTLASLLRVGPPVLILTCEDIALVIKEQRDDDDKEQINDENKDDD